jgi:hypothetical protein
MTHILLALLLTSNATGRTLVRQQQGTLVPIASQCKTLICNRTGVVSQVYFDGTKLVDRFAAWTMNGTVPQVARSGLVPPGAGPYSGANYYQMPAGSPLDFSGDFSICFVFTRPAPATASTNKLLSVYKESPLRGYFVDAAASNARLCDAASACASTANGVIPGAVNVLCVGVSGTTGYAKLNAGATATGTINVATSSGGPARLGEYDGGGLYAIDGTIYEAWGAKQTPSDGLFTPIIQSVKAKAGITAW